MEQILQALHRPGYTTDGPDFAIGRPDGSTLPLANRAGVPVVAKLFPAGGGESTFANMQELWRARLRGRSPPPRLAPPNQHIPSISGGIAGWPSRPPFVAPGPLYASPISAAWPLLL